MPGGIASGFSGFDRAYQECRTRFGSDQRDFICLALNENVVFRRAIIIGGIIGG
jgi:hypothetical protein